MKLGHDDLGSGDALALVDFDRNAAAIVHDGDGAVRIETHIDGVAIAGERLVDRVVDDLVDQVMEAVRVRAPDVHRRALPDGLEAFQNLNVFTGILFAVAVARTGVRAAGHASPIALR